MTVHRRLFPLVFIALLATGCASSPRLATSGDSLSLAQVLELRERVASDSLLIEQLQQRSMAFALTADDTRQLRENGVSDVLIAYLQGRTAGQRDTYGADSYTASRHYAYSRYYAGAARPQYGSPYYGSSYYGSPYYGSPTYAPYGSYYGGHGIRHGFSHHHGRH